MASIGPFRASGPSTSVALTTTLTSVSTAAAIPGGGETILIVNACTVPVAVDFGPTAPTAVLTSPYIVRAGERLAVSVGRDTALFAAAMPIGTASASVYFMRGDGSGS
jgi:hypothetical protein